MPNFIRTYTNKIMGSHLLTQTWRKNYSSGHNLRFNPPIEYIQILKETACIHFVHTGKCAGGSILMSLRRDTENIALLEYHVFDAGECISRAIDYLQSNDAANHFFVVATRDPLKRWESSFNWDLHNLILKRNIPIEKSPLNNYANINSLAHGIADDKPEALRLGKWAHMGKGLNFYTPIKELDRICASRLFAVRTEHINQDYNKLLDSLPGKYLNHQFNDSESNNGLRTEVPQLKNNYKKSYPAGIFSKLDELYNEKIKEFLADDYVAHDFLASKARNL